ncbi:MAG: S8 family serine peptidase, partial [Actinomycetota bacterium]
MRKRTAVFAVLAMVTSLLAAGAPTAAQTGADPGERDRPERISGTVSDGFELRSPDELVHVFIQLDEPSVAEFTADTGAGTAAQKAQADAVGAQQDLLRDELDHLIVEERAALTVGANGFRAMVRRGDIGAIRATDGVESVAAVARYHLDNETSVPWIGGDDVQTAGFDGTGISIAVIDTGIDYTHSALDGSGDASDYDGNDPGIIEPGTFPTDKVVGGFDFAGPTYDASDPALDTPSPDPDPLDVNGHGTHVAATAAGVDDSGTDDVGTGMAPGADLYAYKVFGDVAGSTELVADAIERALDPNNDGSIEDAVDVINMSLGSPFGHPDDPSAIAAQNAVDNGVVVVASAGNSGPVPYVTGSPAVADGAISVAASIDGGVEVLGIDVTFPDSTVETFEAQPGDFGDLGTTTNGDVAVAEPLDACTEVTSDVTGDIALIQRGTCTFTTKVRNAEDAGAIGAIVFNNTPDPPIAMAHDGTEPRPDIPAVMVSLADGEAILDGVGAGTVTATLSDSIIIEKPELGDNMADFTSRGPGFGNVFKPDLSAPGFNIDSAAVGSGSEAALSSGTSMAAPHVAGAAAQLLDWDGDLTPEEVKALLMNSATHANIEGETSGEFEPGAVPIATQGTGIIGVDRVVSDLGGYATPGGLAFHFNPAEAASETRTVDITRLAGDATYSVEVEENQTLDGVDWSVSETSVTTSGGSASVDVTVDVDPAALASDDGLFSQAEADGWLTLTNDADPDDEMVVGLVAVADPASTVSAQGGE